MALPDKSDLKSFLQIDGWSETKRSDHYRYRKQLPSGEILRTKVSFGRGPAFNNPSLWHHVWKDQLQCASEDEFWESLKTKKPLERGRPTTAAAPIGPTKPTWLYEFLVNVLDMQPEEVLALSEDDAMEIYMRRVQPQPRGR